MTLIPVVLDEHPAYLDGDADDGSLLLAPVGAGMVLDEVAAALTRITPHGITVLSTLADDRRYAERVRQACRQVDRLLPPESMADPLAHFDACDMLLLISPRYYAAGGLDLQPLAAAAGDGNQTVHHLLAFETTSFRSKELVHGGTAGQLRRVQRYFEPATWPFSAGVIATVVPVLCLLQCVDAQWTTLAELRAMLATSGTPSVDLPLQAALFDLGCEEGMLALCEQRIVAAATASPRAWSHHRTRAPLLPLITPTAVVAPSACLVGPVAVCDGAMIDADALVVGPALIGPGARIGRGSVVAQCAVGAGVSLPENSTVRHSVVMGASPRRSAANPRRAVPPAAPPAPRSSGYLRVKRVVEPVLALLAIVMLLPVFVVIAALIRLTSPGPVFYGDRREGKDGRLFRCWKFRTMVVHANEMQRALASTQEVDGPHFKMERDPRVTPVGRWLRNCTLDELPQIVNILRGEMSFVGPRPGPRRENQICVPWRSGRLSVQPGLTGLWQVCRHDRSTGDFHQWIEYDLLYVRHASLAVDVRIVLATVAALVNGRPARVEQIIRAPRKAPQLHAHDRSHIEARKPVRELVRGPVRDHASLAGGPRTSYMRLAESGRAMMDAVRRTARLASIVSIAVALALIATRAGAQGTPGAASGDSTHPPVGERYWTLAVDAGQGYSSNVRFDTPNGTGDVVTRGSGEIGAVMRDSRTQLEILGSGSMSRYDKLSNLNQFEYGMRANLTRSVTPRLSFGAALVALSQLSSNVATTPGLPLLPFSLSRTQSVSGTATYQTSATTTITSAAGYTRNSFATSALDGSNAFFGRLLATRAFTPSTSLGALYEVQRSVTGPSTLISQAVSGDGIATLGPVRWHLRAGIDALTESSRSGPIFQPQGEVEVQNARTANGTITLRYGRSVSQEPGVGPVLVTDEISASLARAIWSGIALDVNANEGWSRDLDHTGGRIISSSVTAGLRRNLPRGLWVELGGFYQTRTQNVTLVGTGVMLTAGYRVTR